jgi:hypothetical protein
LRVSALTVGGKLERSWRIVATIPAMVVVYGCGMSGLPVKSAAIG